MKKVIIVVITNFRQMRIYSKKITSSFRVFMNHPDSVLFAITGDIDNLGVFVANKGRTKAENLVDVYNRIIGDYIYDFSSKNRDEIFDLNYIPSGEEIYVIGVARSKSFVDKFLNSFSSEINSRVVGNEYISEEYVTISFGFNTFHKDEYVLKTIPEFLSAIDNLKTKEANLIYLELQEHIRFVLAKHLDGMKFSTLPNSEELGIGYRNIVFSNMLEYKIKTKKMLIDLGNKLSRGEEINKQIEDLSVEYGLSDKKKDIIENIKKNLPIND